jgi:peptide deformylase
MVRNILQIGNPILTQKTSKAKPYDSDETKEIVKDLLDTCIKNSESTGGLSAPQIGYAKRICVCRRIDLEHKYGEGNIENERLWEVMINPEIIELSEVTDVNWEGCLSIGTGKNKLFGPVERPIEVTVSYTRTNGEKTKLTGKDYFSHVIQHELDHLEGILFMSYVQNPQNLWKNFELDQYIEKHGTFPPIV